MPISQDLRARVLRALERGERPTAIADRFEVRPRLGAIRCGTGSRRRDSGAVYRLGATAGAG